MTGKTQRQRWFQNYRAVLISPEKSALYRALGVKEGEIDENEALDLDRDFELLKGIFKIKLVSELCPVYFSKGSPSSSKSENFTEQSELVKELAKIKGVLIRSRPC